MYSLDVTTHRDLGTPTCPSRTAHEVARLWATADKLRHGFTDLVPAPASMAAMSSIEAAERFMLITVSTSEGELVAFIHADLPIHDNTGRMYLELRVGPGYDEDEVLRQLWPELERFAHEENCHQFIWFEPSDPAGGEIAPQAGTGGVQRTQVTEFLGEHGFELSQIEVIYELDVEVALQKAVDARLDEGYRTESWVGPTPERFIDGLISLRVSMSADIPHADRPTEEECWDAERIRRSDRLAAAAGQVALWTVAVDTRTGELVGHTYLEHAAAGGEAAVQMNTHVAQAHRGHGLGLAMKRANLIQLAEVSPHIRNIYTFNSSENTWMLAVNDRLGGRVVSALGVWEASGGWR